MKPGETDSKMVRLQKKVLENLKLKLKRDIEELEQKIKRIIAAENQKAGDL